MPPRPRNPNAPRREGRAARFHAELDRWYDENVSAAEGGGAAEWVRSVLLSLLGQAVYRTPVLSGTARGNWLLGVGSRPSGWSRGRKDPQGDQTVRQGLLQLVRARDVATTYWIVNNVPYALRLERGHSKQAPNGMLAMAIESVSSRYGVSGYGLAQYLNTGRQRGQLPTATVRAS